MNTTLIIMAAGIGSRFGTGIKQLAKMAPNGEIIMDFSIYDAKEAGFTKVVFVIRRAIEAEFKEVIGNRLSKVMPVEYVYQELEDLPDGYEVPAGRVKPWGTGQAILACKNVVKEPFVIINADDYYGKEAFIKLHDFLISENENKEKMNLAMAGFSLKNTLSENGAVTRGVCVADANGYLEKVIETTGIQIVDGKIQCDNDSQRMCNNIQCSQKDSSQTYQNHKQLRHNIALPVSFVNKNQKQNTYIYCNNCRRKYVINRPSIEAAYIIQCNHDRNCKKCQYNDFCPVTALSYDCKTQHHINIE